MHVPVAGVSLTVPLFACGTVALLIISYALTLLVGFVVQEVKTTRERQPPAVWHWVRFGETADFVLFLVNVRDLE